MRITRNPNTDQLMKSIKENGGYCVCSVVKNEETRCICKEFLGQQTSGECHCGLYTKTMEDND